MKRVFAAFLFFVLAVTLNADSVKENVWGSDLKKAVQSAKKQKKKTVMLFFTAPGWCGPCRRLESETMPSAGFQKLAKKAELVKMDFSERNKVTSDMRKTAQDFKIQGFPTLIVLDPSGKEKGRIVGYRPEKNYLRELEKLVKSK